MACRGACGTAGEGENTSTIFSRKRRALFLVSSQNKTREAIKSLIWVSTSRVALVWVKCLKESATFRTKKVCACPISTPTTFCKGFKVCFGVPIMFEKGAVNVGVITGATFGWCDIYQEQEGGGHWRPQRVAGSVDVN